MGEKEFNTNEVEEEMSLSGQLSRRRRQRRMTEESNSSAVGADEKKCRQHRGCIGDGRCF